MKECRATRGGALMKEKRVVRREQHALKCKKPAEKLLIVKVAIRNTAESRQCAGLCARAT